MMPTEPARSPAIPARLPRKGDIIHARHQYRLEERLGKGSFGAVYRATLAETLGTRFQGLPEQVAVKFTVGERSSQRLMAAKRELAALQVVDDARVPRLHDWSLQPGAVFLVTDFFPRGNLHARIAERKAQGTLPTEAECWRLLSDLLGALTTAHRRAVLHLDIKPENVLLADHGGYVLTDFGISQATLFNEGEDHIAAVGTPGYQAPEQFLMDFDSLDTQTDLFGVGATVWSFCTGIDLSRRQRLLAYDRDGSALVPATKYRPDLSAGLSDLISELTQVDPSNRPGGAAEARARVRSHGPSMTGILEAVSDQEAREVHRSLLDPLWLSISEKTDLLDRLVRFEAGTVLCREGEEAYEAFLFLKGRLRVEHGDDLVTDTIREGTMIGEIATLTGLHRTATVRCVETTYACVFNAADLERFLAQHPVVALRALKDFSERMLLERSRKRR